MLVTSPIASLAMVISAVMALPTVDNAVSATLTRSTEISDAIGLLRKERNNKRSKNANPGGPWNGAVQSGRTGVSTVSALVTVPTPSPPPGGPSDLKYSGMAWVGMDGWGTNTLWQSGIAWNVQGSHITFSGWWDWCGPEGCGATGFDEFSIRAGDVVSMVVTGSGSSGTAYLTNANTGQMVYKTLSDQAGSLAGAAAEWIVEDFFETGGAAPFASINPITFSQCSYADSVGSGLGVSGAYFLDDTEQPDGRSVVYTTQTGPDSFMITYNGTSY